MIPLSPFLLSHPFARPVPTRSRGPHMVSRPDRGAAADGGAAPPPSFPLPPAWLILPPSRSPRRVSSSLRHTPAPARPGVAG